MLYRWSALCGMRPAKQCAASLILMSGLCSCGESEAPIPEAAPEAASVLTSTTPALLAIPEQPPFPAENPITQAKIELGRHLFFDTRLSGDGTVSCATCHDPARGWGDGRDISTGYPGSRNWRNSPTIVNAGYLTKLLWTGEASSLETQARGAATSPIEGNVDEMMVEERLWQVAEYRQMFREVFGAGRPTFDRALQAIATFERAVVGSTDSPFDRTMRGETNAMSAAARRGMVLFETRAGCSQCHHGALLTDEKFHVLGVPRNPFFDYDVHGQIAQRFQLGARTIAKAPTSDLERDAGRYHVTGRDEDRGAFRTAPLRYLSFTAPYMHNGTFLVLEEVIDFYDRGGGTAPNRSALLQPLELNNEEKDDLLAFLLSLSGTEIVVRPPDRLPDEVLSSGDEPKGLH